MRENQEKRDAIVGTRAQILMRGIPSMKKICPKFNIIRPAVSLKQSKQHRITWSVCLYEVLKTHARARTHTRARCWVKNKINDVQLLPKVSVYTVQLELATSWYYSTSRHISVHSIHW